MIFNFRKNKIKKESHIATTPDESKILNSNKKHNVAFLLWNIFSIGLYLSYTLFVIYKLSEHNFLSKIIIYLLCAYGVAFLILLLISIGNRTKLKYRLKNLQSAANFFKYFIQIVNFVLSIVTAISAFVTTGTTDISAILYAVLSLAITFIFIIVEIAKIIIRKNLPLIKYNFLEIRDKLPKSTTVKTKNNSNNIEISKDNQNNIIQEKEIQKPNESDVNHENEDNSDENKNDNSDPYDDITNI